MTSWLSAIEVSRRSPRRPRAGHNHPVAMATIEAALSGDGVGVGVPCDVDERELVDGHSITRYPIVGVAVRQEETAWGTW